MRTLKLLAPAALLALFCVPAIAHPGHPLLSDGFVAGLEHPWSGADHLLAMTMVGFWAAQLGKRALWALPACFMALMAVGAAAGVLGYAPPHVETGITVSLVALGLLVAFARKTPLSAALALAGVFALFHGAAHAVEARGNTSFLLYAAGFLFSTAVLHGAGLLAGLVSSQLGNGPGRLVRVEIRRDTPRKGK